MDNGWVQEGGTGSSGRQEDSGLGHTAVGAHRLQPLYRHLVGAIVLHHGEEEGQCNSNNEGSQAVLDLTASTTDTNEVTVYCPPSHHDATAACHAESSRQDSTLPAAVTATTTDDATLQLHVTAHTLWTCLITCKS